MREETKQLVLKIEQEINGRKGIGWEEVDDDIQEEIREAIGAVIEKEQPRAQPQAQPPQEAQWMPLDSCPVRKLVILRNANRMRGDDTLGCVKDIGYLHEDGWFSTFSEHRAMAREAFTHWAHFDLPEPEQSYDNE